MTSVVALEVLKMHTNSSISATPIARAAQRVVSLSSIGLILGIAIISA